MRETKPPFKFDLSSIFTKLRRLPTKIDGVSIRLPFVNITVKPNQIERKVAREVVIRLADRRVLNAFECCDGCIDSALKSLQEIRSMLVNKQVELADLTDGPLYLLLGAILEAIRQFFTFEQRLGRSPNNRQIYFSALEMLRGHIHRCLAQIANMADMQIPKIADNMRYDANWQIDAYVRPKLPD